MKLFDGISRTDYQDLFRAIGLMLDQRNLRDVRIWEHAEGLVIAEEIGGKLHLVRRLQLLGIHVTALVVVG